MSKVERFTKICSWVLLLVGACVFGYYWYSIGDLALTDNMSDKDILIYHWDKITAMVVSAFVIVFNIGVIQYEKV